MDSAKETDYFLSPNFTVTNAFGKIVCMVVASGSVGELRPELLALTGIRDGLQNW